MDEGGGASFQDRKTAIESERIHLIDSQKVRDDENPRKAGMICRRTGTTRVRRPFWILFGRAKSIPPPESVGQRPLPICSSEGLPSPINVGGYKHLTRNEMNMKMKNGLSDGGAGVDFQVKTLDGWVGGFQFLTADTGQKNRVASFYLSPSGEKRTVGRCWFLG